MSELNKLAEAWIKDGGPAALVIREWLEPVEGRDGVFFPATFAPEQGTDPDRFRGGYHIDEFPDGTNVCLIDTVGSQANRIEPLFLRKGYDKLVPRVVITAGDRMFSLLEAGHRAADAIVRCSALKSELAVAFKELLKGNAEPLAKIAPTSFVFGVWDSRGTSAKQARLVSSTIRAFNVYKHKRHAQYNPVVHFRNEALLDGIDASDDDLAQKGYVSQPIGKQPTGKTDPTHGGVQLMTNGFIRRDATLGLAALRRLAVREADGTISTDRTEALRRYILGLSLVALTADQDNYLRQGCNLVPAEQPKRQFVIVKPNGDREVCSVTHDQARKYADEAAERFVIGPARQVVFEKELAKIDIKGEEELDSGVKYEGCEVVSVDTTAKSFVIRVTSEGAKQDLAITTNSETKFKKGRSNKAFSDIIAVGAKLDLEVTNDVATTIKIK